MSSAIRRHVNPTTFIALLALVFALTGGAFAASGGGAGNASGKSAGRADANRPLAAAAKKAKPAPKGKTGPRGPAGAKGATGATGTTGPVGATGPTGATGATGPTGTPGANGTNGANGAPGEKGATGSPWTAGGTLPSKATETGTWVFSTPEALEPFVSISFTIPLAEGLEGSQVHYVGQNGGGSECPGTVSEPAAAKGQLCVYEGTMSNPGIETEAGIAKAFIYPPVVGRSAFSPGASVSGAVVQFVSAHSENTAGSGSWAVTAP
jgi:hypothetical protein